VEDTIRTNLTPTASQTIRKVPLNKTDYITTVIKKDNEDDWGTTTTSGIIWSWYEGLSSELPYKMGPEF
jgi:hypothetical protein